MDYARTIGAYRLWVLLAVWLAVGLCGATGMWMGHRGIRQFANFKEAVHESIQADSSSRRTREGVDILVWYQERLWSLVSTSGRLLVISALIGIGTEWTSRHVSRRLLETAESKG